MNDIVSLWLKCIASYLQMMPCFYVEDSDLNDCAAQMQDFSHRLSGWLLKNRLTPGKSKTKLMLVTAKTKPNTLQHISFSNDTLKWVEEIKYLDIIVDDKLKFKSHIES